MNSAGKIVIKMLIITALIISSLYTSKIDFSSFMSIFANLSFGLCSLIILIFMLNFHLAAMRSYLSYRQFNINISYNAAKHALLSGQLGGVVPVFGAVISQSINLNKSSKISSTTSSFMFFYDKIIMAMSGVFISIFCIYFLLQDWLVLKNLFADTNNTSLAEFIFAVCLCFLVAFLFAIPQTDRRAFNRIINLRTLYFLSAEFILSLITWILSASCFVLCIKFLGSNKLPQIGYLSLLSAGVIVSFIASMPVSVNGWGIREFAAITIFSLILIPNEVALGAAMIVGVLSTVSLFIMGLVLSITPKTIFRRNFESLTE